MDGQAGILSLTPPVGVECCWEPSLGIGCGASVGPVLVEMGVLSHSIVSPMARKRVMFGGNVGSLVYPQLWWGPCFAMSTSGLPGS